jgi:hypothetical protein
MAAKIESIKAIKARIDALDNKKAHLAEQLFRGTKLSSLPS